MSSVQHLREFIRERLTAAAEEIFSEVEKTIVRYEEEIKLLDICWKPEIKLTRIDPQKLHVSNLKEASAIQQLCNQERRSSQDQEEAEPQWSKEEQVEPDPVLTEEQGEPEYSRTKEEQKEPKLPLVEEWEDTEPLCIKEEEEEPKPPLVEEQEKLKCPPMKEVKEDPDSLWLKHEQQVPEHLPTRHDQKDLHRCQEEEQLVQKQFIALIETSTLQEGDLSEEEPRTEQLSFHISPVVETKDQEGSSSTVSESQSHTDTKRRSFRCDLCGRCCKNNYRLERHYRTHTGEKPFSCQTCRKSFSQIGDLNVHQRTHTGERPFSCLTCGKSFSRIDNLNVHKKIHTGEKPFICPICRKGFIGRYHLNVHQRTHTGLRPFSCETCGKSFIEVRRLNIHMKQKHTDEK